MFVFTEFKNVQAAIKLLAKYDRKIFKAERISFRKEKAVSHLKTSHTTLNL